MSVPSPRLRAFSAGLFVCCVSVAGLTAQGQSAAPPGQPPPGVPQSEHPSFAGTWAPGEPARSDVLFGERLRVETHVVVGPGKERNTPEWFVRAK